jgi:glucose/arabinose dehydrogenase
MLTRSIPSFFISSSLLTIAAMSCSDDDDDDGGAVLDASAGGTAGSGGNAGNAGRAGSGGNAGANGGASEQDASVTPDAGDLLDSGLIDPTPDSGYLVDGGIDGGPIYDACSGGIPLPSASTYVAPGLCARAVATHQGRLRQIAFAPNGDLFGVTVEGEIRRYRDVDQNGSFDDDEPETVAWADTGGNGNNVHIDAAGGYLYAGTPEGVKRWPFDDGTVPGIPDADASSTGDDVLIDQPATGSHTYHTVHVFGGWMYVQMGSAANVSDPATPDYDTNRSVMKRFWLADFVGGVPFLWTEGEVFAVGLRNTVGFTRHANGSLYGVVNGIDDLMYSGEDIHQTNPGDMIVRLHNGGQYGYPYCFSALHVEAGGLMIPAGTQLRSEVQGFTNPHTNLWCLQNSEVPETLVPAHSAPLDIVFLNEETNALPARWAGGAFVTLHGSWNTASPTGHQVIWVPFDEQGDAPMPIARAAGPTFPHEIVLSAKVDGESTVGPWSWEAEGTGEDLVRPVGVAISPVDGALYVSSDNAPVLGVDAGPAGATADGAIYRIGVPH